MTPAMLLMWIGGFLIGWSLSGIVRSRRMIRELDESRARIQSHFDTIRSAKEQIAVIQQAIKQR